MADTYLNVVNGEDQVLGRELRSVIHAKGLRHREVHIWFMTKDKHLIFQRRGPDKDTYPNLLSATAGGHVEEQQDYKAAALAEVREETGLELFKADLIPLAKVDVTQVDVAHNATNVVFRMVYLYRFNGTAADLQVEAADGAGFVVVPLMDVLQQQGEMIGQMVPGLFDSGYMPAWQALRDVLHI